MLQRERNAEGTRQRGVNPGRVRGIYNEGGLAMRRNESERLRVIARTPLEGPARANWLWAIDFTRARLANRRNFRLLNLIDRCTRGAPRIEVDMSLHEQLAVHMRACGLYSVFLFIAAMAWNG